MSEVNAGARAQSITPFTFDGAAVRVVTRNGELRIRDIDLGVALGVTDAAQMRRTVSRYLAALMKFGAVPAMPDNTGEPDNQAALSNYLNLQQAAFIAARDAAAKRRARSVRGPGSNQIALPSPEASHDA